MPDIFDPIAWTVARRLGGGNSGGGSSLPSGSSPNQYLVTDSEGNAKWEDKLCWSESSEEEIQPECHPELMANEDIFNYFHIDGVANLTVGETYIVNWNGVEYQCTAQAPAIVSYDAAPVYAVLGNIAKAEETGDTGEPFLIRVGRYSNNELSEYQIYAFDGSTELTLSIRHVVETIHKISGKYVEGMGWSEKSTKELLPETFVPEPARQIEGLNAYFINCALEGGKKYTVIYNGVAYDVISQSYDESVFAGNFGLAGGGVDTGEPFILSTNTSDGYTTVGTRDSDGITIAIYCEGETIHPIDKKYLPSGGGGGSIIVHAIENSDGTFSSDKTRTEVCDAVDSGKVVFLDFFGNLHPLKVVEFVDGVVDRDSTVRFAGMYIFQSTPYYGVFELQEETTLRVSEYKLAIEA